MKQAIKDAKWWMFLPFACLMFKMSQWVFKPDDYKTRIGRDTFQEINLAITIVITTILIALIDAFFGHPCQTTIN